MASYHEWKRREQRALWRRRMIVGAFALMIGVLGAIVAAHGETLEPNDAVLVRTACMEKADTYTAVGFITRGDEGGFGAYLMAEGNTCAFQPRYVPAIVVAIEDVIVAAGKKVTIYRVLSTQGIEAFTWIVEPTEEKGT